MGVRPRRQLLGVVRHSDPALAPVPVRHTGEPKARDSPSQVDFPVLQRFQSEPKASPNAGPYGATPGTRDPSARAIVAFHKMRNDLHVGSHREDVHDAERRRDPLRSTAPMSPKVPVTCGDAILDARGRRRSGAGLCERKRAQSEPSLRRGADCRKRPQQATRLPTLLGPSSH
jgi:hypothetical protein